MSDQEENADDSMQEHPGKDFKLELDFMSTYPDSPYKSECKANFAKFIGVLAAIFAVVSFYQAYHKKWQIFLAFFWTLVPPIWFYLEFYYLFDNRDDEDKREALKDRQELLRNIWAAVLALLAVLYIRA